MSLKPPQARKLDDLDAEAVRQSHHEAIRELQSLPAASMRVIGSVALVDATLTLVPHGLGRAPYWCGASVVRSPASSGRIEEIRDGVDRTRYVGLKASGYGATITVDVAVL